MQYVLFYLIFTSGITSGTSGSAEFNTLEACQAAAVAIEGRSVSWRDTDDKKYQKEFKEMGLDYWTLCTPKG